MPKFPVPHPARALGRGRRSGCGKNALHFCAQEEGRSGYMRFLLLSCALRDHDLRRGNRLANVPLGVISHVYQQAANGSRQQFSSYLSLLIQLCR
jgi:hypothetical protein